MIRANDNETVPESTEEEDFRSFGFDPDGGNIRLLRSVVDDLIAAYGEFVPFPILFVAS